MTDDYAPTAAELQPAMLRARKIVEAIRATNFQTFIAESSERDNPKAHDALLLGIVFERIIDWLQTQIDDAL